MAFIEKKDILPTVVGGGAGLAASKLGLFGKKSTPTIDISQQLNALHENATKNRNINSGLYDTTTANLGEFKTGANTAMDQARSDFAGAKGEYLGATDSLTNEAKDALRKNLYSDTFSAMPDTLQAIREASAAGGGLDTGSYQKAVRDVGVNTARTVAGGERDIQLAGLENKQKAQENVFNTFNQLSQKLTDSQLGVLTKVLDTGDINAVRKATTDMGLNDNETQGVIDLMNFQQSGNMAANNAAEANKYALLNALISGGSHVAGAAAGGK